ncbi:hypothetical protein TUM16664_35840 [Enterobacter cloacae]|nr:hypothetical protein TUM16664_35840 [Enterobacter cloacae]
MSRMEQILPWQNMVEVIEPFYPKAGNGRRPYPAENRVEMRGELKTWIGDSKPDSDIKHYVLQFKRLDGISWLARFGEVTDEKH